MLTLIKKQLLARRMRQLISLALEAIYSEQSDMSTLVASLSGGKDGIDLVRAYISIRVATRLTKPFSDTDIENAIEQLRATEGRLNTPGFDDVLNIHRELAELHWLRKQAAILKGKLAHKNDEYSYEGTIYALQRDRKGPVTDEEREKAKEVCGKMADLNHRIEERELKLLKDSDSEAHQRRKEELDIRAVQDEVDAHEDLKADAEVEEITAGLEERLKGLGDQHWPEAQATDPGNIPVSGGPSSNESGTLEHYQGVVSAFSDLIAEHVPLIGDCSALPYPKRTILYAIVWVRDHVEMMREQVAEEPLRENCSGIINTLNFLLTRLANDWHDIDPEDKDAVAKLAGLDSFPDWALPLKAKYINDERASAEAYEVAFQVIKDKVHEEEGRG